MTRVDFYVLPTEAPRNRALLACRLAEKAFSQGHRVYIHTGSEQQSQELDDLLWTFRQGSFIPHAITGTETAENAAVLVGHQPEPAGNHLDVLINTAQEVPLFFGRFERVAELVDQQPGTLQQARERYKFYRDRGYELQSHNIKS